MVRRSRVSAAALGAALALGAPGCGGSDQGDERERSSGPEPAASPQQFSQRYERLTGVALDASPDGLVGTRLDAAAEPNRFARLGTYSLVWTRDRGDRKEALRGARDPGARGIRWRPSGGAWSAVKTFGPHLVLDWSAGPKRRTTPQFNRFERAVRAAYRGRPGLLEPAERPCGQDPLRGSPAPCSVRGVPVTVASQGSPLDTPAFQAEVRRVEVRDRVKPEFLPAERARGRFVIVTYRLRTKTLIRSVTPQLRIGKRTFDEAPASVFLARSRLFPLPPAAGYTARAAFDIPKADTAQIRARGALVLPAEIDDLGDPSAELAQGWIRLRR